MSTLQIKIDGNDEPVDQVKFLIGTLATLAETHVATWGDLAESNDEVRPYQAAMLFTGNAVVALAKLCMAHLEAGLGDALFHELKMLDGLSAKHDKFWELLDQALDGKPPALPLDIAERRAKLDETLAALSATLAKSEAAVHALDSGDKAQPLAAALLETAKMLRKGASETVAVATFAVTPQTCEEVIGSFKQMLLDQGVNEEEVDAKIAQLGDSAEAIAFTIECLGELAGMTQQSTKNGAVLAAEVELAVLAIAVSSMDISIQTQ